LESKQRFFKTQEIVIGQIEKVMNIQDRKEFDIASEEEMTEVVSALVPEIRSGDIIFLEGDLGAGKTTFARYLLKALGFVGKVKSPTFTWVEPYDLVEKRGFMVYRLHSAAIDQLDMLGFRDHQRENSVFVIEWPDRLKQQSLVDPQSKALSDALRFDQYILKPTQHIAIEIKGTGRRIVVTRV
jgi:tRNA threonylcarbamoyladenosine biosynthesis protein TsaE